MECIFKGNVTYVVNYWIVWYFTMSYINECIF